MAKPAKMSQVVSFGSNWKISGSLKQLKLELAEQIKRKGGKS